MYVCIYIYMYIYIYIYDISSLRINDVVSVVCCQVEVSGDELITRHEESYRLWCVVVCDLETSRMRRP